MDKPDLLALKIPLRIRLLQLAGGALLFTGFGLVAAQVYFFVTSGRWIQVPASYLTVLGPDRFVAWLDKPERFILLHRVVFNTLDILPVSLLAFLAGWMLLRAAGKRADPGRDATHRTGQ